jgi:two-component system alkaline phosphatase synthesis response regulator PhoP
MPTLGNILVVEDQQALRRVLGDRLRKDGYAVQYAETGDEGLEKATRLPLDLIILDVMLPGQSGFDVCRGVRRAGLITPILMLTARTLTADKIAGLKMGADDYVTKPFDISELSARVEALLRRAPVRATPEGDGYRFGTVHVDLRGTAVTKDGAAVSLSAREFQLLRYFVERPGVTLSREELLTQVWGYSAQMFTRTVDVHLASLRQKLEPDAKPPRHFLTMQGLGYKFEP